MSIKIRPGSAGAPVKINYEFPTWCGKPPPGTHLDVLKDDKLIEKLLIDEKKYYIFGDVTGRAKSDETSKVSHYF